MPSFSYVAINAAGKTMKGRLMAANEVDLERRLKEQGMEMMRYKVVRSSRFSFGGSIRIRELIIFCVHMEQLERAGVPLLDSLADLRDTADSPAARDLLSDIYERVKSGNLLSAALEKHPKVFDKVFVGLVKAGEETGQLADTFMHLGAHLKWNDELRRKVKKSLRYPIFLLVLLSAVIALQMMYVVPQITKFLTSQGFDLPFHTRALIATSAAFVNYWYIIFGLPIFLFIIGSVMYRNSESFAYKVDKYLLKIPFIGAVILKASLARFTRFFTITFVSGIEILECIETAKNVINNRLIKETIQEVKNNVANGNTIAMALTTTERFPHLVLRMFKVGEESGNMEMALNNVNYFYEREVNDAVEAIVGVIQPALTIVMGALLFWIVAAVFGPVYDSFSKMNF